MTFNVFGIDAGFVKTGLAVIEMSPHADNLIAAKTLVSDEPCLDLQIERDVGRIFSLFDKLGEEVSYYKPAAVFVEMPVGGAQRARPTWCMAMASGFVAGSIYCHELPYELYIPSRVEKLLGISLDKAKKNTMTIRERTVFKKERSRGVAIEAFPSFEGWPAQKTYAEDAFDAAAVFLAARKLNKLYADLRAKLQ